MDEVRRRSSVCRRSSSTRSPMTTSSVPGSNPPKRKAAPATTPPEAARAWTRKRHCNRNFAAQRHRPCTHSISLTSSLCLQSLNFLLTQISLSRTSPHPSTLNKQPRFHRTFQGGAVSFQLWEPRISSWVDWMCTQSTQGGVLCCGFFESWPDFRLRGCLMRSFRFSR